MLLVLTLSALTGCFASHRFDPETGDEFSTIGGQYGTTAYMNAGSLANVLDDAADGDAPVSVTAYSRSGNRENRYEVSVNQPAFVIPTYVSDDTELMKAAAYGLAYNRERFGNQYGQPAYGGPVSAGQVTLDKRAACPKTEEELRTQSQKDACQDSDINMIIGRLPVAVTK